MSTFWYLHWHRIVYAGAIVTMAGIARVWWA